MSVSKLSVLVSGHRILLMQHRGSSEERRWWWWGVSMEMTEGPLRQTKDEGGNVWDWTPYACNSCINTNFDEGYLCVSYFYCYG